MARRVHEIAKEHGLTAKELLARLHAAGVEVKAASSNVDEEVALKVLGNGQPSAAEDGAAPPDAPAARPRKQAPAAASPPPKPAAPAEPGPSEAQGSAQPQAA